jgi:hypothetical protein
MTYEKYDRCSTVMGKKDFTDGYIVPHFIDIFVFSFSYDKKNLHFDIYKAMANTFTNYCC